MNKEDVVCRLSDGLILLICVTGVLFVISMVYIFQIVSCAFVRIQTFIRKT